MTRAEILFFAHQDGRRLRRAKPPRRGALPSLPKTSANPTHSRNCALLQRFVCPRNFLAYCAGFTFFPLANVKLSDFGASSVERAWRVVGAWGQGGKPISGCLLRSCGKRRERLTLINIVPHRPGVGYQITTSVNTGIVSPPILHTTISR